MFKENIDLNHIVKVSSRQHLMKGRCLTVDYQIFFLYNFDALATKNT